MMMMMEEEVAVEAFELNASSALRVSVSTATPIWPKYGDPLSFHPKRNNLRHHFTYK